MENLIDVTLSEIDTHQLTNLLNNTKIINFLNKIKGYSDDNLDKLHQFINNGCHNQPNSEENEEIINGNNNNSDLLNDRNDLLDEELANGNAIEDGLDDKLDSLVAEEEESDRKRNSTEKKEIENQYCNGNGNCKIVAELEEISKVGSLQNIDRISIENKLIHYLVAHSSSRIQFGICNMADKCHIIKNYQNNYGTNVLDKIHTIFYHPYNRFARNIDSQKFCIDDNFNENGNDNIKEDEKNDSNDDFNQLDFGISFVQWNHKKLSIEHKFLSIKDEVTKNEYAAIPTDTYDNINEIAKSLVKCDYNKLYYKLTTFDIVCIKLYTDCTQLCTAFRRCYRKNGDNYNRRCQFYVLACNFIKYSH